MPVHELDVTSLCPGGAMGALRSGDERALDKVLLQLGHVGWAALDWGEGDTDGSDASAPDAWSRILAEGEALWPLMEPGKVMTADGRSWSGVSPSGARRGDRFITAFDERLSDDAGSWRALRSLHEKLRAFGFALGARMRSIRLTHSGDTLFACFPGNGALYGPHYDGGPHDSRKLTMILYVNADWRAEDGGALMIYDAGAATANGQKCWRSVQPLAGRLVVFRSDRVLHKVAAAHARRFALTAFFSGEYA